MQTSSQSSLYNNVNSPEFGEAVTTPFISQLYVSLSECGLLSIPLRVDNDQCLYLKFGINSSGYTVWCLLNVTEPSHLICVCVLNLQHGSYFARFGISTFKPKGSSFTIPFASVWKKRICSDTSSNSSLPVQVSIGQFNPRYESHCELRNWNPRRCTSPDERRTAGSPSPQPTY